MKWMTLVACGVWLACPTAAAAHRLDEYLQATRIALAPDSVRVEIDLTPGVNVAPRVAALIDVDRDGALSPAEQHSYSELVVRLTDLQIDGRAARLIVVESEYPSLEDIRAGVGTIRLTARATLAASSRGGHRLTYANVHHPEMSAYLVNALAPPPGIYITGQQRDAWQHQLTLDYVVDSSDGRGWRIAGGLGGATLMTCALGWFRRSLPPARESAP